MIERMLTRNGDVLIGRDSETGSLLIHCIDGVVIEVPPGGRISVRKKDRHGTIRGLMFHQGVGDTLPPWLVT